VRGDKKNILRGTSQFLLLTNTMEIKSESMRWEGHVARLNEKQDVCMILYCGFLLQYAVPYIYIYIYLYIYIYTLYIVIRSLLRLF
jgi:hypothetical protein